MHAANPWLLQAGLILLRRPPAKRHDHHDSLTAILDAELLHDSLLDIFRTAHHARRGAAQLDKVLASLFAVEHCVERRYFVHLHLVLPYDLRYFLHRSEREPASVLFRTNGEAKHSVIIILYL